MPSPTIATNAHKDRVYLYVQVKSFRKRRYIVEFVGSIYCALQTAVEPYASATSSIDRFGDLPGEHLP